MTWSVDAASGVATGWAGGSNFTPPLAYILALKNIHFITPCLMWKALSGWKILDFEIPPPPRNLPPPKKIFQLHHWHRPRTFPQKCWQCNCQGGSRGGDGGMHPPSHQLENLCILHSRFVRRVSFSAHEYYVPQMLWQLPQAVMTAIRGCIPPGKSPPPRKFSSCTSGTGPHTLPQ